MFQYEQNEKANSFKIADLLAFSSKTLEHLKSQLTYNQQPKNARLAHLKGAQR